jgi:hypothetical protein
MIKKRTLHFFTILSPAFAFLALLVAIRPSYIGSDYHAYKELFYSFFENQSIRISEPLFIYLGSFIASISVDHRVFLFSISIICFFSSAYCLLKLLDSSGACKKSYRMALYVSIGVMLFSPFYFSSQTNVLRQGLSVPFLTMGFIFFSNKEYLKAGLSMAISVGFHYPALLHIALLPLFFVSQRKILILTVILSAAYLLGSSESVFRYLFSAIGLDLYFEKIASYGDYSDYKSGVRADFWLFSILFIATTFFLQKKLVISSFIPKLSMVALIPFLLFGFMAYSDRLLFLLWSLIPVILALASVLILQGFSDPGRRLIIYLLVISGAVWFSLRLVSI